jgi:hypothetical protein
MINLLDNNLVILIILAVLLIADILLLVGVFQLKKKVKIFLKGKKVKDLEEVLSEHLKKIENNEKEIKDISKWNEKLQGICDISINKVGIVRFNPFKDTGGDQSFAIALLDSHNDGLVLSSLFGREGTRIYSKPIEKGLSSYNLSKEEGEAIKKAIG